ncbi:F-box domain-containing protein [Mycena venus]|uniref:F-box domain-containing protein n=1 Tax=Mycena venus TaxID=2733690 RepID=A0A8H6Y1I1_9AGAR|nr:F-box domain-containing protein [Mycena venus]
MPTVDLRRRLAELEGQIIEHKRALHELEDARLAVERELYASAAYPVLTLPAEITSEIFIHCLPPVGKLRFMNHRETVPLIPSAVCRVWRNITLTTPALWSTLHVILHGIPHRLLSKPGFLEGSISLWLARAGVFPLSLLLHAVGHDALSHARDIVHRCSHRVEYLELDIGDSGIHELELDSVAFPLLRSARLEGNQSLEPTTGCVFHNAPRLHDLNLPQAIDNLVPPWVQLTRFEGRIFNLDLFNMAVNLTEATCHLDDEEAYGPFKMITHLRLSSLTVLLGSLNIIKYLTLPALKILEISEMDNCDYRSLEPFLTRSSPSLVSLSVRADYDCEEHWHPCLPRVASTLENLVIDQVPEALMLRLFHGTPDKILHLLPNLRTLSLSDVPGGVNLYFLVDFLYSRSDKLRAFRLVWTYPPFLDGKYYLGPSANKTGDTISGHLSRLARSGIDIYLGTVDKNYVTVDSPTTWMQIFTSHFSLHKISIFYGEIPVPKALSHDKFTQHVLPIICAQIGVMIVELIYIHSISHNAGSLREDAGSSTS